MALKKKLKKPKKILNLSKSMKKKKDIIKHKKDSLVSLERKATLIQRSTKTEFKFFERPHNYLRNKSKLYYKWHLNPKSEEFHRILLSLFMIISLFTLAVFSFYNPRYTYSFQSQNIEDIRRYNDEVYESLGRLEKYKIYKKLLPKGTVDQMEKSVSDDLTKTLYKRKNLLKEEISLRPVVLKNYALPKEIRENLPEEAKNLIEKDIEVKGELSILHSDDFDNKKSENYYKLEKDNNPQEKYNVYFIKKPSNITYSSQVTVRGLSLDEEIVLESDDNPSLGLGEVIVAASPYNPVGEQKTAVILFNFSDNATQPFTSAQISASMFTNPDSVDAFYRQNSYNQTYFTGDVFGWYTISSSCSAGCNVDTWANLADQKVINQGVNLNNYPRRLYIFPRCNNCGWAGLGEVGSPPTRSWINGYNDSFVFAHELGHNLGSLHSSTRDCGSKTIDVYSNCSTSEYGDPFDVMGGSWNLGDFNVVWKNKKEWIPNSRVQTVTTNGTYNIYSLENSSSNLQAIKIYKPNSGDYYYFEYRQPIGFDSDLGSGVTRGTTCHTRSDYLYSNTYLLDFTPENNWSDIALSDGAVFNDDINNIHVTQVSHNSSYVTLSVTFGSVTYHTITASAGSGGAISPVGNVSVANGTNQAFTITPNSGYHINDVLIDGSSVGAVSSYAFSNVTTNHTISASFAINTYTINASAGVNGSINPSGNVSVSYGSNQTFTVTPNGGYYIDMVLVDGFSVGAVSSYAFSNVTTNHTISASFISSPQLDHFTSNISGSKTAGQSFSFTIIAYDQTNSVMTSYSGPVTFSSSDNQAVLPTDNGIGWSNGQKSFNVTFKTSGVQTITVSDVSRVVNNNFNLTVTPGPVSLLMSTVTASPTTVSVPGSSTITVTLKDQYNNPISGHSITLSSNQAGDVITQPGLTNSSGICTGIVSSALVHTSTITAYDNTEGVTLSSNPTINFVETPLAISNVSVTNIKPTSSTITWSSNKAASSKVEYGPTTSLGSSTTTDASLVTSHSVTVNNLTASARYYFRVVSTDAGSTTVNSNISYFTTTGHPNGFLVTSSNSGKVYFLANNQKQWIASPTAFNSHGFRWDRIIFISDSELNSYPEGNQIQAREGTLITSTSTTKVYVTDIQGGVYQKRHIASPSVFNVLGFRWSDLKWISAGEINSYQEGNMIQ